MSLKHKQFNHVNISDLVQDEAATDELISILSILFPTPAIHKITPISSEYITMFSELLQHYAKIEVWSPEIVNCVRAVFKALLNSAAFNKTSQNLIVDHESILSNIYLLSDRFITSESLLRICLKFLTNLVVHNKHSATIVWDKFQILIINQLKRSVCPEMTVYLYYNILLLEPPNLHIDVDVLQNLLALHKIEEFDITMYCLQNLLLKQDLFLSYESIENKYSVVVLKTILDAINVEPKYSLTETQLSFTAAIFNRRWQYLVSFYRNQQKECSDVQALEVIYLVDILATLTSNERELSILQTDRNLFIDTFFLLKDIDETGKLYQNIFTPINKLGDERSKTFQGLEELLGFKSTLVRIIGNLCSNHTANQDEIRELDGIGLILDCCNIDLKNPLIMQWAIFAIRNICKGNEENQKSISSMTRKSAIGSHILREMENIAKST